MTYAHTSGILAERTKTNTGRRQHGKGKGRGNGQGAAGKRFIGAIVIRDAYEGREDRLDAGVGVIIHKLVESKVLDLKPRDSRTIELTLNGNPGLRIIGVYAPPANRDKAEHDKFYQHMNEDVDEQNNTRPTVIAWDWDARLHGRQYDEEDIMGEYGACRGKECIAQMSDMANRNRCLLADCLREAGYRVSDTYFKTGGQEVHLQSKMHDQR